MTLRDWKPFYNKWSVSFHTCTSFTGVLTQYGSFIYIQYPFLWWWLTSSRNRSAEIGGWPTWSTLASSRPAQGYTVRPWVGKKTKRQKSDSMSSFTSFRATHRRVLWSSVFLVRHSRQRWLLAVAGISNGCAGVDLWYSPWKLEARAQSIVQARVHL